MTRRGYCRRVVYVQAIALCLGAAAFEAHAADLFKPNNWTAMASDRPADTVGDSLTVLIYENSQAQDSTQNSKQGSGNLSGQLSAGALSKAGQIGISGAYSGGGQTGRTGQMIGQISVVVDAVLPNGDLHVTGEQTLNINGDRTRIRLKGRVRRQDITSTNTVLSSFLADATIDYGSAAFGGRSAGLLGRMFSWARLH